MIAQLSRLRTLVLKDLDPLYGRLEGSQADDWLKEIPQIEADLISALQAEVLGDLPGGLVERHLKQLQYDCTFLLNALYRYTAPVDGCLHLHQSAEKCLQQILTEIEERYAGCFMLRQDGTLSRNGEDYRIRVLLSAEGLAYFFKLLYKAGALDAGPVARLVVAISKNFTTAGMVNGQLSSNSIMTKYKQVVQATARSVRALLVKMLRLLDEEFTVI